MAGPEIGHTELVCPGCGETIRVSVKLGTPRPYTVERGPDGSKTAFVSVIANPQRHHCSGEPAE